MNFLGSFLISGHTPDLKKLYAEGLVRQLVSMARMHCSTGASAFMASTKALYAFLLFLIRDEA